MIITLVGITCGIQIMLKNVILQEEKLEKYDCHLYVYDIVRLMSSALFRNNLIYVFHLAKGSS